MDPLIEKIFADVHHSTHWHRPNSESVSGEGSSAASTKRVREALPGILSTCGVKTLLDVPCGDFNWMRYVDLGGVRYVGGDVVSELVDQNNRLYGLPDRTFVHLDLVTDPLPPADLIVCRDCLNHLSHEHALAAIANVKRSGIPYLLVTTYTGKSRNNQSVPTGNWTAYNLRNPPFNFPDPVLLINEDCREGYPDFNDKYLGLWRTDSIPAKNRAPMKTTILLPTCRRPRYLYWSLTTLCRQDLISLNCDVLVFNDGVEDESEEIVRRFAAFAPVRYMFTGQRNRNGEFKWRVPGFVFNYGIQSSVDSEVIILGSSDVYHLGGTVSPIIQAVRKDPQALGTQLEVYDDFGCLWNYLQTQGEENQEELQFLIKVVRSINSNVRDLVPRASPRVPFFMAMRRDRLMEIGGYDEDFTGFSCEDTDLMERLLAHGCHFAYTGSEIVHLYHGVRTHRGVRETPGYDKNLKLLQERKGKVVRNEGRRWGVLS